MAACTQFRSPSPAEYDNGRNYKRYESDDSNTIYVSKSLVHELDAVAQCKARLAASRADGRMRIKCRFVMQLWVRHKGRWQYMPLGGSVMLADVRREGQVLKLRELMEKVLMQLDGCELAEADASTPDAPTQPLPALERDASFDTAL